MSVSAAAAFLSFFWLASFSIPLLLRPELGERLGDLKSTAWFIFWIMGAVLPLSIANMALHIFAMEMRHRA